MGSVINTRVHDSCTRDVCAGECKCSPMAKGRSAPLPPAKASKAIRCGGLADCRGVLSTYFKRDVARGTFTSFCNATACGCSDECVIDNALQDSNSGGFKDSRRFGLG